ncbi:MAG: hypothetical protein BWY32_02786 [bacterium ADurb.Bin243]|nr:MAG: hypothetical protein BWY32_02786 [bacterium ADurb.Bin243]HOD41418.1 hypothetical protein [Candidatus Wallbacteria bacterium]
MNKKDTDINKADIDDKTKNSSKDLYYNIIFGIIIAVLTFLFGLEIISQICVAKYGPPRTSFDKKMIKKPDGTDVNHYKENSNERK